MYPDLLKEYLSDIKPQTDPKSSVNEYFMLVEHLKSYDYHTFFYILQEILPDCCFLDNEGNDTVYIGDPVEDPEDQLLYMTMDIPTYRATKAGECMIHHSDEIIQAYVDFDYTDALKELIAQTFDEWWVIAGMLLIKRGEILNEH
ncbi:MAG: hypothetical protein GTN99_02785 [Candidatus Dadabacteria bacterium]|nr:hypothetical protein [Candidatus Dadabacteria bacterium]